MNIQVNLVTQDLLQELMDYDKHTGIFKWKISSANSIKPGDIAGSQDNHGYINISIKRKLYKAHRLAWFYCYGEWPDKEVDHINGDKVDNRICNLRVTNRSQNSQNQRKPHKNNKSGFLGVVYIMRIKKWRAHITVKNKSITLGYYETPENAHEAYLSAKRNMHEGNTI